MNPKTKFLPYPTPLVGATLVVARPLPTPTPIPIATNTNNERHPSPYGRGTGGERPRRQGKIHFPFIHSRCYY